MADTPPDELKARQQRKGANFGWDVQARRYVDLRTNTVISPSQLRGWVDTALERTGNRIQTITQRLIDGKISYPSWATLVQPELKAMHTGLSSLAIGGRAQWTATEAGRLGQRLRMLYSKLEGLGLAWEQGLLSGDEMLNRIGMAVQAGRGTYEGLFRGMMGDIGMTEEQRVLGAAAHCSDCPPISGYWAPFGSLPGIGDSACLSNCACTFEYR